MSLHKKFKLDIDIPRNIKNNEKYKEISRRFQYALIEYYTNYNIEKNTLNTHIKCRNLNYFIDNLRDEFNEHVAPLIKNRKRRRKKKSLWDEEVEEKILNKLQEETGNSCPRNPIHYNKEIRILRKEMEDYCDERDVLKGELYSMNISKKERCNKFRSWTIEYLVNFWNDYFWRKYITYKAMIEPFVIDNMCSVITLFDNTFNCENDDGIRFHLPARIRDKYPIYYGIKRNPTPYNKEIRILRKEMEDYCDERDELIGELNSRDISEKEKCDKFRRWTLEYLVNFWNDHFWRKYITYKALIEPFDINNMCSVITLFDNKFNCENDGDIRFHLPARIRDKHPNKLQEETGNSCARNPTPYNKEIRILRKEMEDYCDERDVLKGELHKMNILEEEKCNKFRSWTIEYLVNFWNDTYKALIEPFDINNMCSVITLFDNKFNCENDGDIRFHLPAQKKWKIIVMKGNSCARNPTPYNKEIRILRKEMEDYCDERDVLKGELHKMNILEEEKCNKFRSWTIEYLVNFWNDHFWRKYITYKAMIEPFEIDPICSVITLFDNVFNCKDDDGIRFHLPARIKRNFYKKKLAPTINKDKIVLEDETPQSYVVTTHSANLTEEIPELGESPEITDTVFYPNISTSIQSTANDGIRFHLPARIRDNYPLTKRYVPKKKLEPENNTDKIALEDTTPKPYVETSYNENSTEDIPEVGKSPEIPDTVFYPNITESIQITSPKAKGKKDPVGINEYKGVKRVSLQTYIPHYIAPKKAASASLMPNPVTTPSPVSSAPAPPVQAISQSPTRGPSIPAVGGSLVMSPQVANMQGKGSISKAAPTSQIDQGRILHTPLLFYYPSTRRRHYNIYPS
ncbi:STP1 protein [Plasmodium vivax]|uniref:STP1 protein n=1 Tax=Plasmodium vivax TaxID=5855 RepID=A0A565A3D2_PLAVI|nr:STP1 protein [Plasmodium vivax]